MPHDFTISQCLKKRMERIQLSKKQPEALFVPESEGPDLSVETHNQLSPERLEVLRNSVLWSLKHASGRSGIERGILMRRSMLSNVTDSKQLVERRAELDLMEKLYGEIQDAKSKLWQKIRVASVALFLAFSYQQDSTVQQSDFGD